MNKDNNSVLNLLESIKQAIENSNPVSNNIMDEWDVEKKRKRSEAASEKKQRGIDIDNQLFRVDQAIEDLEEKKDNWWLTKKQKAEIATQIDKLNAFRDNFSNNNAFEATSEALYDVLGDIEDSDNRRLGVNSMLLDKANDILSTTNNFRKELGLSVGQTFDLIGNLGVVSLLGGNLASVMSANAEYMGIMSKENADIATNATIFATAFGSTEESVSRFNVIMRQISGDMEVGSISSAMMEKNLADAYGIGFDRYMQDISNDAQSVALFSKDGGDNIRNASVQALALGINLSRVANSAEQLLDFETSITKQFEASVLLGRQLDFSRMREAAATGNLSDILYEQVGILENIGDLNQLSYFERKSLAEAMGLEVAELFKIQANSENITKNLSKFGDEVNQGVIGIEQLAGAMSVAGSVTSAFKDNWQDVLETTFQLNSIFPNMLSGISSKLGKFGDRIGSFFGPISDPANSVPIKANAAALGAMGVAAVGLGAGLYLASMSVEGFNEMSLSAAAGMIGFTVSLGLLALVSTKATIPLLALGGAAVLLGGGLWLAGDGIKRASEGLRDMSENSGGLIDMITSVNSMEFEKFERLAVELSNINKEIQKIRDSNLEIMLSQIVRFSSQNTKSENKNNTPVELNIKLDSKVLYKSIVDVNRNTTLRTF